VENNSRPAFRYNVSKLHLAPNKDLLKKSLLPKKQKEIIPKKRGPKPKLIKTLYPKHRFDLMNPLDRIEVPASWKVRILAAANRWASICSPGAKFAVYICADYKYRLFRLK
jgi:hypothetical protein